MHYLVIKHGALGDVVRTSYFAAALRHRHGDHLRISWLTSRVSAPLLRFNPNIDDIWTDANEAKPFHFDRAFSLDDEREVVEAASALNIDRITGAYLDGGSISYSDDSRSWFDMGLVSRHGKGRADMLKKENRRGHAEIFCELFDVRAVEPCFFGNSRMEAWAVSEYGRNLPLIGINPFAGGRWPSKELRPDELLQLIRLILDGRTPLGCGCSVVLLGAGADYARNLNIAAAIARPGILTPNTDDSILRLAAVIGQLSYLITSDSLAMHLAVAQGIPTTAFFAPTSAPEIDAFGIVTKVVSTAADYCSYRKDADNSSITAERIVAALASLDSVRSFLPKHSRLRTESSTRGVAASTRG